MDTTVGSLDGSSGVSTPSEASLSPSDLGRSILNGSGPEGQRDVGFIADSLSTIRQGSPSLADAVARSVEGGLSAVESGNLARLTEAQATAQTQTPPAATTAPGQTPEQAPVPAEQSLLPFAENGLPPREWVEQAAKAPPGSPTRIAYDAIARHAGTTHPSVMAQVVGEVAANRVSFEEVAGITGPLSGAELRYRIGADREQIVTQAEAEIRHLTSTITTMEQSGAPLAQVAEMRGLLQQSMNHYALASDTVGDLRASGLASDPRFATNLTVAEAYRKGGDDLAGRSVPGNPPYSMAEAATNIRTLAGPEQFDAYIDSAISVASLRHIPDDLMSPEARTNAVRQLGVGFFRTEIGIGEKMGSPLPSLLNPFPQTDPNRGVWLEANLTVRKGMMEGVSQPDRDALEWGKTAAIGRELYPAILSEATAGVAGLFIARGGQLIQRPLQRAATEGVEALAPAARQAGKVNYHSAAMQAAYDHPYIPANVQAKLGTAPSTMTRPHVHHVVELNGRAGDYRAIVRESQDILRRHGIDPITGVENLVWAPNKGHTIAEQTALRDALREVDQAGLGKDEIVRILDVYGRRAATR